MAPLFSFVSAIPPTSSCSRSTQHEYRGGQNRRDAGVLNFRIRISTCSQQASMIISVIDCSGDMQYIFSHAPPSLVSLRSSSTSFTASARAIGESPTICVQQPRTNRDSAHETGFLTVLKIPTAPSYRGPKKSNRSHLLVFYYKILYFVHTFTAPAPFSGRTGAP